MVCVVVQAVYLLVNLLIRFQNYILTLSLGFILFLLCKRFSCSKSANTTDESNETNDQVTNFKQVLSAEFSDCCWLDWPLTAYNRFRVGGNAEIFFRPSNLEQLLSVLKAKPKCVEVTTLGMGSNVLIRDGGVRGLVIQIVGRGFAQFKVLLNEKEFDDSENSTNSTKVVECGAGLSQLKFAKQCAKAGVSGLEFLCGIPGTIGGALRMNAGAHGTQVSDRLLSATVVDPNGVNGPRLMDLKVDEMKYAYRECGLPEDWIFVGAKFRGDYLLKSREEIECTIEEMMAYREETQPVNEKTAGCTFRNPSKSECNSAAWHLVSEAECGAKMVGGAVMSPKHCNFLINTGHATAEDLEDLGETVQKEVEAKFGIRLIWEVKRIGLKRVTNPTN